MNKENDRFKLYKDEKNNWVLEDKETTISLSFKEGEVDIKGFFYSSKNVITNTKLVGDTTRAMSEYLRKYYKELIYGIPKNKNERLEKKQIIRSYVLDKVERQYFYDFGFVDRQIRNNYCTIIEAKNLIPDFIFELSILKGKVRDKKNPRGYIINALKGRTQDIKNRL
jgi:hypothetical protein